MNNARGGLLVEMDEKARTVVANLHRGIYPDATKLSKSERAEILKALDAESLAETVFKHPPREAVRNRCRAMLGV